MNSSKETARIAGLLYLVNGAGGITWKVMIKRWGESYLQKAEESWAPETRTTKPIVGIGAARSFMAIGGTYEVYDISVDPRIEV